MVKYCKSKICAVWLENFRWSSRAVHQGFIVKLQTGVWFSPSNPNKHFPNSLHLSWAFVHMWSLGMLIRTLWSKYGYPHLTDNDIKAWDGDATSKWESVKPWTHMSSLKAHADSEVLHLKFIWKGMCWGGSGCFIAWALEFGVKRFAGDLFSQKHTISYNSWDLSGSCQGQYVSFSGWPTMKSPHTRQHGEAGETTGAWRIS